VLPPPPPELGSGFVFFGAGSEPVGANEATSGPPATWTGVTADGAAASFSPPPVALPAAKAAPKASTMAAAAMAAKRPGVIGPGTSRRA